MTEWILREQLDDVVGSDARSHGDRAMVLGLFKAKPPLRGGRFASLEQASAPWRVRPAIELNAIAKEITMLRIYSVALDICRDASRIAKLIEKHDTSLANQLRRCASSVPLNIREGSGSFGGHRKQRYHTALGSSGEVLACYDTAEAMGYVDAIGSEARRRVDHVIGTLVNVLRLRR